MKLLDIKVTDGPNYWSVNRHRLVVALLDLEDLEERPTNLIPGFYDRIVGLMPTLHGHRCSEGQPGGFFERVRTGTWMGHVVEHLALELQTLAGMDTGFGRTRQAGARGLYHVVFSCEDAEVGRCTAEAAVRIATCLIAGQPYSLGPDILQLRAIKERNSLGPSTAAIVAEAKQRGIPVLLLNNASLIQLGYGAAQKRIEAAVASTTSNIAVELASDKAATKRLLSQMGIPVPAGETVDCENGLKAVIGRLGYPLVIKPLDGNHGRGVSLRVRDEKGALTAFKEASRVSDDVICEKYVTGRDFRALVINYKFTAAALRTPASVSGDGIHTIGELVDKVNEDPRRGECHENVLTKINIDSATVELLKQQDLTIDSILPLGRELYLKETANLSTGGTATDVTDTVHPGNRALFERVARIIGLDICGIDVIATDLSIPLEASEGVIIEVNAGPGLRMHLHPSQGQPRNVGAPIVEMLFPRKSNGRIPIIGVTGTNGKTTTTRLIAHIGKTAGHRVGYTTTNGIYIDDNLVMKGDCTGPQSARIVLKDSAVDLAVLECARGGLLRQGLGFDRCDVAVITNIAEDHLGMQGIDTLDQLARLKGVLAESVSPEGCAVLSADDPRVLAMRERLRCRIALYSMDADNAAIRQHVRDGGIAAIYENGYLTVIDEGTMIRIGLAETMPITFSAQARFNINNALAAALAAYVQGIRPNHINLALTQFIPGPETLPGRMNIFDFGSFKVIADYAHNTHGLRSIGQFLKSMPAITRIGVIAGVGDRRDEDIVSFGAEAAGIFDEIIVRQDKDLRGRSAEQLNSLICDGIRSVLPGKKITVIPDELTALKAVLDKARRGTIVSFFADDIDGVVDFLRVAHASGTYTIKEIQLA
jgi:cyanophycin synthetase